MKFKLKSVKAKILFLILPAVLVIVAAIVVLSSYYARLIIVDQTNYGMKEQLNRIQSGIETRLVSHQRLPETFAKTNGSLENKLTLEQYRTIAMTNLETNPDTFAVGMFYAPYAYDPQKKYTSVYAYRSNGTITTTEDYNAESYNYPSQLWYTVAENGKETVYTDPYYDTTTQITMVTSSVPVYNAQNKFLGVATADIDMSTLQKMIAETKAGQTGWAFLLDHTGTYIAGPDSDKIMKVKLQEDQDPSVAKLGKTLLDNKSGMYVDKSSRGVSNVYYQQVPETGWTLAIAIPDSELSAPLNALTIKLVIAGILGLLLIVVIILLFSRHMTGLIGKISQISTHWSRGDFTRSIQVDSQDEFGQMADSFNEMKDHLKDMIGQVGMSAEQVAAASQQISASTEQVARGSNSQASAAQTMSELFKQLSTAIGSVAEGAEQAAELSKRTRDIAVDGGQVVRSSIDGMNVVNEQMSRLAEDSNKIGDIIEVIDDIAEQTNLLALNAAIEAARAGEQGRGFAVVADEVRKLAERSGEATKQIGAIIKGMQQNTERSVQAVGEGVSSTQKTGDAFETIIAMISESAVKVTEIAAASEQQAAQSNQVLQSIESISAATQESAASSEETAATAQSLADIAEELNTTVSRFKVS